MAHAAGVHVALLRSEVQVGRDAEAEVAVGIVLRLADLTLVHLLPVPCPGDGNFRRVEVVDRADEGVRDPEFHLLLGVDQGGGTGCRWMDRCLTTKDKVKVRESGKMYEDIATIL